MAGVRLSHTTASNYLAVLSAHKIAGTGEENITKHPYHNFSSRVRFLLSSKNSLMKFLQLMAFSCAIDAHRIYRSSFPDCSARCTCFHIPVVPLDLSKHSFIIWDCLLRASFITHFCKVKRIWILLLTCSIF